MALVGPDGVELMTARELAAWWDQRKREEDGAGGLPALGGLLDLCFLSFGVACLVLPLRFCPTQIHPQMGEL